MYKSLTYAGSWGCEGYPGCHWGSGRTYGGQVTCSSEGCDIDTIKHTPLTNIGGRELKHTHGAPLPSLGEKTLRPICE